MSDEHLTERDVRSIAVEEIMKHVKPIQSGLDKVTLTLRSLYSNGSGGPPGYLEVARKEDDERFSRLFEIKNEVAETKEYLAILKDREEQAEKQRKFWMGILWKVGAPVGGGILGLLGWGIHQLAPVAKILWEDYLKAHPVVMERMKNLSEDHHLVLSSSGTQDATGAMPAPEPTH